jgi:hypothetical protein
MIVELLRPFRGVDVRRLTGWVLMGVALPRLPFWPGPAVVYPLNLLPQETFGWTALLISMALLATCGAWRLRFIGRLVAVLAFVFWVTMAVATTSVTSLFIDAMFAYAMFGEIVTQRGDCT